MLKSSMNDAKEPDHSNTVYVEESTQPPAQSRTRRKSDHSRLDILYGINDVPPWYLCILFGFQQYLTAFGANFSQPIIISSALCMMTDLIGISELLGTCFFISGLTTILMVTLGCRLPILQGASFSFLIPTISLLKSTPGSCPYLDSTVNATTLPDIGSEGHREIWQKNLRELQGSLMVASLLQIVVGFTGLLEFFLPLIGPLTITPTIALIGLALFQDASHRASGQWYIALLVVVLILVFSQYLQNVPIPCGTYSRKYGCNRTDSYIFKMFPVVLAVCLVWLLCYIFTVTDVFPPTPGEWGHQARTDNTARYLQLAAWFRFPYPGQWGVPTVSVGGALGLMSGVLMSMIESIGDYYACARISGAPPPPPHAINRGIGVEGVGCLLAGAIGGTSGVTSFSENIGTIGITKIASRRVILTSGIIMMVLGCFGKFGILLVTMPSPIVGGMFLTLFGMVTAVGLSNLQHISLQSSRNLMILGTSLFLGISLPLWLQSHPGHIKTGNAEFDQILSVLFQSSMFVGGFVGFILDNTISGTPEERGLMLWKNKKQEKEEKEGDEEEEKVEEEGKRKKRKYKNGIGSVVVVVDDDDDDGSSVGSMNETYSLPGPLQRLFDRWSWPASVPFCPSYNSYISRLVKRVAAYCCCHGDKNKHNNNTNSNINRKSVETTL